MQFSATRLVQRRPMLAKAGTGHAHHNVVRLVQTKVHSDRAVVIVVVALMKLLVTVVRAVG